MSKLSSRERGERLYALHDQTGTLAQFCAAAGHMLPKLASDELQAIWYALDSAWADGAKHGSTYDDHVGN